MHLTSRPLAHVFRVSEKILLKWSSRGNSLFIIFYFAPHRLSLDGTQLGADRFQSKSQASSREVAMLVKDILASKGTTLSQSIRLPG